MSDPETTLPIDALRAIDAQRALDALREAAGAATEPTDAHAIGGVAPGVVASPGSYEQLSATLALCSERGLAVSPVGGLTRTAIGSAPSRYNVALDMTRLDGMVAYDHADLTVTVQAGMTVSSLQTKLATHGQFLAIDPPLPDRATIGGTLAVGSSGPLRWQGWGVRELVIGIRVAAADGVMTKSGGRVVKNVSGYDMSRLHIGGLGTLGVIAEASFKLTPLPAEQATVTASFKGAEDAFAAGLSIFHGNASPLALTWISPVAAQKLGLARKGSHHLAVRLGGRPRTLTRMVDECNSAIGASAPVLTERVDEAEHERVWRAIADFGWDDATVPQASIRLSMPPATAGQVLGSLESAAATRGVLPAIVAHVATGTVLLSLFSPSGDKGDGIDPETLRQIVADARKLARQRRGTAVVERAPVATKPGTEVWEGGGEERAIMRRLKEQYDPDRVLNPGRFVDGI